MGMFEEKPHSPHSDRNRSGPAARNSEKKSRMMARENDCGRRERFWLARTILSRETILALENDCGRENDSGLSRDSEEAAAVRFHRQRA